MSNPTQFISLHGDLGRATIFPKQQILTILNRNYIQYFRIFIPPGAKLVSGEINEWNGQSVIARHGTPPTSSFGHLPISKDYILSYLKSADRYYPGYAGTGKVTFLSDIFASPYLTAARGGWFYVKVDADRGWQPDKYSNVLSVMVDSVTYNNWYDHSGANGGPINWSSDIEGVSEYGRTSEPLIPLYPSIYQTPKVFTYVNASGHSAQKTLIGYRQQHNLNEPAVAGSDKPPVGNFIFKTFYSGYLLSYKIYIPVGATSLNVLAHVGQVTGSRYFFVARMGAKPGAHDIPVSFDSVGTNGFTLAQLRAGDCIGTQSSGGNLFIIKNETGLDVSLADAGWLYVDVHIISGSVIDNISEITVNALGFEDWYDHNVIWGDDGDPLAGVVPLGGISVSPLALDFGYVSVK